jgi:hypothetical protein
MLWPGIHKFKILDILTSFRIQGTEMDTTAAELNILHGVTATKDELNTLDAAPAGAAFTIGDEDAGVITVDVQLKDANNANVATERALPVYLAGVNTGLTLASITEAGLAVVSEGDGLFIPNGSDSKVDGRVIFEDGLANLQITGDAGESYYMVVVMPNGSLAISSKIEFASGG